MIVVSGAGALHAVGAAFPGDLPLPPFGDPFVTVTCCVVVVVVRVVPGSSSSSPFTVIYSVSVSVSVSVTALPCSLGASVFCGDAPLPFVTVTVDGAGHAASSAARICATPKLVPCATGDALTPPATAANAAARWSSFIYTSQNGRWLREVYFRAVPSFCCPSSNSSSSPRAPVFLACSCYLVALYSSLFLYLAFHWSIWTLDQTILCTLLHACRFHPTPHNLSFRSAFLIDSLIGPIFFFLHACSCTSCPHQIPFSHSFVLSSVSFSSLDSCHALSIRLV